MDTKFIHLLYVPTLSCNMACKYCYIDDTKDLKCHYKPLDTLKYAVNKFKKSNIIPFNISLHGGEVTTLSKEDFESVAEYIHNYYEDNRKIISSAGFTVGEPHIKTNLYDLDKHIDAIKKYNVSISGSLDLPLSMHNKFRVTKGGEKSLDKILKNIELLKDLPNKKKVSATIFEEHYKHLDEIVEDIKYLDKNTCLDMNDFNFMIGFDYNSNGLLHPLKEDEMVNLFKVMHENFDGTNLDYGVNNTWFAEFGPNYCTNCTNCGDKFFLLEKNGDIYSCVRGQEHEDFYYGNIYKDSVQDIMNNAHMKIFSIHNKQGFNEECSECPYLYICKTGCPFVKKLYNSDKSYTCKLQKELYVANNYDKDVNNEYTYDYICDMHPELLNKYTPKRELLNIINSDKHLKYIYDSDSFILKIDDNEYKLTSQILYPTREITCVSDISRIYIYVKKNILYEEEEYPINNSLYIILLSGDLVTYGDEGRTKQKHIMTHQIYKDVLDNSVSDKDGYYKCDITDVLRPYYRYLSLDKPNNIFFTTNALRNYHYLKQKNNAYYHIEAINLPFQNMEFYYLKEEL